MRTAATSASFAPTPPSCVAEQGICSVVGFCASAHFSLKPACQKCRTQNQEFKTCRVLRQSLPSGLLLAYSSEDVLRYTRAVTGSPIRNTTEPFSTVVAVAVITPMRLALRPYQNLPGSSRFGFTVVLEQEAAHGKAPRCRKKPAGRRIFPRSACVC